MCARSLNDERADLQGLDTPEAQERRLRSKEHNRADWRSTLRYARVTQCTPNCDINRLRTRQNQIGTAFGTARVKATLLNY